MGGSKSSYMGGPPMYAGTGKKSLCVGGCVNFCYFGPNQAFGLGLAVGPSRTINMK